MDRVGTGGVSLPVEALAGDTVSMADLISLVPARERAAEASAPYQQRALFDE